MGHEDTNDFDTLARDPILKLCAGRQPRTDGDLASQPAISRFENRIASKTLFRLGGAIVGNFIDANPGARKIVLDFDGTDDPTYGQQECPFYNGYYAYNGYSPLLVFATVDDDCEQQLICALLRKGNSAPGRGTVALLKRIVGRLQQAYPDISIVFRADCGFANPQVYEFCEKAGLEYVVSFKSNLCLERLAAPALCAARALRVETGKETRTFDEVSYGARYWSRERRMVIETMVPLSAAANQRFLVTNLPCDAEQVFGFYARRGDAENRIKELKCDLSSGRTSCHRFLANQFRLLSHAAAMILMQSLRRLLKGTGWARLQAGTIRSHLLKVTANVVQTCRRIAVTLPASFPERAAWQLICNRLNLSLPAAPLPAA